MLFHFVFLTAVSLLAADKPWPVFAFQNGVHFGKVEQRIAVLKELGYDGIGSANLGADLPLPTRLKAYDKAGLTLSSFYVGGRLEAKGHSYNPAILSALPHLEGRDTYLELYLQGNKRNNTDEQAVAFVQEIADKAKAYGVKIVLYPHTGFYIDRLSDAVRASPARPNATMSSNVQPLLSCSEPKTDLAAALKDAGPLLAREHQRRQIDGTSGVSSSKLSTAETRPGRPARPAPRRGVSGPRRLPMPPSAATAKPTCNAPSTLGRN